MSVVELGPGEKYFVIVKGPNKGIYKGSETDMYEKFGKINLTHSTFLDLVKAKRYLSSGGEASKGYWAVAIGAKPGIYYGTWDEVDQYIGKGKSKVKKFKTKGPATKFFNQHFIDTSNESTSSDESLGWSSSESDSSDEEKIVKSIPKNSFIVSPKTTSVSLVGPIGSVVSPKTVSPKVVSPKVAPIGPSFTSGPKITDIVYVVGTVDENVIRYGIIITQNEVCYYGETSSSDKNITLTLAYLKALQVAFNILEDDRDFVIAIDNMEVLELIKKPKGSYFDQLNNKGIYDEYVFDIKAKKKDKNVVIKYKSDRYIDIAKTLSYL